MGAVIGGLRRVYEAGSLVSPREGSEGSVRSGRSVPLRSVTVGCGSVLGSNGRPEVRVSIEREKLALATDSFASHAGGEEVCGAGGVDEAPLEKR